MKKIIKILNIYFCVSIAISFLGCNFKNSSNCDSIKMQLLLEDVLKKKAYFPIFVERVQSVDSVSKNNFLVDSSLYFNYLYSSNIIVPNKEFYLHWNKQLDPSYPDSVKLKTINDTIVKNRHANTVAIKLLEVNEDTTKLKIFLSYGTLNNFAINDGVFSYVYDKNACHWSVLDSTIRRY